MAELSVMVDASVWLGNYVATRAGHRSSRRFLQAACEHRVKLLYPASTLKDVFYLIEGEFKHQIRAERGACEEADSAIVRQLAWGCVDNMRELATAVGVDESDLWLACKFRSLSPDLGDAMVFAAMQRSRADYLVTLDARLARHAPFAALSPDDLCALQEWHT